MSVVGLRGLIWIEVVDAWKIKNFKNLSFWKQNNSYLKSAIIEWSLFTFSITRYDGFVGCCPFQIESGNDQEAENCYSGYDGGD